MVAPRLQRWISASLLVVATAAAASGCNSRVRAEALVRAGKMKLAQQDTEAAINAFKRALELDDTYPEAHKFLGFAYHQAGQRADAMTSLLKANELSPSDPDVLIRLGSIHLLEGDATRAVFFCGQVIQKDKSSLDAHYCLCPAYAKLGWADRATLETCENTIALNPSSPAAIYGVLAYAYERGGRDLDAIKTYRQGIERGITHDRTSLALAKLEIKNKQYSGALTTLKNAIHRWPENVELRAALAEAFKEVGDYPGAWDAVHWAQGKGHTFEESFLAALREKMPEPFAVPPPLQPEPSVLQQ